MFDTIRHTFSLMKMSWEVLKLDKELVAFPAFSAIAIGVITVPFALFYFSIVQETANNAVLYLTIFIYLVLTCSASVFFKGALVASAITRLRGGDPNVRSGLRHALRHIHELLLWGIISAVVAMLIMVIRNLLSKVSETAGEIVAELLESAWGIITFFVVPVIVSENVGAISAIKRSVDLVGSTWGSQLTAAFGFFIVYVLALVAAAVPSFIIGLVYWPAGVAVFIVLGGGAVLVIQTLEGIFKAALYDYVMGAEPMGFERRALQNVFIPA